MKKIFRIVEKVAGSDTTIMLTGETGTGKGVIARAITNAHRGAASRSFQINCGATPRGFWRANSTWLPPGRFHGSCVGTRRASSRWPYGGTIFLDEIGDMSARSSSEGAARARRGGVRAGRRPRNIKVDARIIAPPTGIWKRKSRRAISGKPFFTGFT